MVYTCNFRKETGVLAKLLKHAEADIAFPYALKDAFLARSRQMKARRGQIIIAQGSQSSEVYLIRSGKVQASLLSARGRETILRDLCAGQIFGELAAIDKQARSASVIAIDDCALAFLTGDEFVTFLGEVPEAGLWMARNFSDRVRDLTEKLFSLANLPVAARLHGELLRLCNETGLIDDRIEIDRMPTHAELAARIGTHREAITRELRLMAAENIVTQSGRKLTVNSLARLQALISQTAGPDLIGH